MDDITFPERVTSALSSSTTGILIAPRTQAQMDTLAGTTPATGTIAFNSTRGRYETFNGTLFLGDRTAKLVQCTSTTLLANTTYYFGQLPRGLTTGANITKVYVDHDCVVMGARIYTYSAITTGTAENISMYIRVNNTTDYLIETIGSATAERVFNTTTINSGAGIALVAGDYFEVKIVMATVFVTPPTGFVAGGDVYLL